MVATVRLDSELDAILNGLAKEFEKKRSEIIREAIRFYAKALKNKKKNRLYRAIEKSYQKIVVGHFVLLSLI